MRWSPIRRRSAPTAPEERTTFWSAAQPIALVLGLVTCAFAVIALTRTGLDLGHLTHGHATAFGFGQTPLLALAELGFGLLLLVAAAMPLAGRNLMTLLGAAALGLGIVMVGGWWSSRMTQWLNGTDRDGWLCIIVGAFVLVVAFAAPVRTRTRTVKAKPAPVVSPTATTEPLATPAPPARPRRLRLPWQRDPASKGRTKPTPEPERKPDERVDATL
jgi:hypothetical protein